MSSDLDIYGHDLKEFAWSAKKLNGNMNFSWKAGKDTPGPWTDEDKIPLPTSFELPFVLGDLPLTLSVTEALLIHPGFTGNGELSQGHFRIQFNGAQNFTFQRRESRRPRQRDRDDGDRRDQRNVGVGAACVSGGARGAADRAQVRGRIGDERDYAVLADCAGRPGGNGVRPERCRSSAILNTPAGQAIAGALSVAKQSVETVLKSNAAAHLDFILTASLVESGTMSIVHCKQAIGSLTVKVGANATVFGKSMANIDKTVFHHGVISGTTQGACKVEGPIQSSD